MVTQTNGGLCEVANKHARKKKTRDDPDSNPDSWRSSLVGVQADSHIFETASRFGKKSRSIARGATAERMFLPRAPQTRLRARAFLGEGHARDAVKLLASLGIFNSFQDAERVGEDVTSV